MSLAIKKFADGGSSEIRTYKRGNDEVDLNAFVRQAEAGFDDWLNKTDIKEKHKKEVRAAYQDMITRINDNPESFVARLGGGFTNTAGITNSEKGFDAYGVAAGYLGKTLRAMKTYTRPKVTSSKQKYTSNGPVVTPEVQRSILGTDPNSFVMLDNDSYDESTRKRGTTHRYEYMTDKLENYRDNIRNFRDFDSEEDYQDAISKLNLAISTLRNPNPNDDWFALHQIGISDVDKFFSTGFTGTPLSQEEQNQETASKKVNNFESYMNENHPLYSGRFQPRIQVGSKVGLANQEQKNALISRMSTLTQDEIDQWLQTYIVDPTYDFSQYPIYRKLNQGRQDYNLFTNDQLISAVIQQAINSGRAIQIPDTSLVYFPGTLEEYPDKSSTVYVADLKSGVIQQVDTHDIEDYRKQYFTEWTQASPSYAPSSRWSDRYKNYGIYKNGGILKAQQGLKFDNIFEAITYLPEDLTDDKRLRSVYNDGVFTQQVRTSPATDKISPGNNQYDPEPGGQQLEQQDYYKKWLEILTSNEKVAEAWARRYKSLQPTTNVHYEQWFNTDGSFNFNQFKTALVNNKKVYSDAINGIGHDFYRGRVYQKIDQNGKPLDGYYNSLQDGYELVEGNPILDSGNLAYVYQMKQKSNSNRPYWETGEPDEPSDGSDFNEVTGDTTPYSNGTPISYSEELDEVFTNQKSDKEGTKSQLLSDLPTYLLGAGRLAGSIQANNRIARTVRKSLVPKLHDTYELYSPVTGAFGEMQLRNRQGAETLSQSYRPFTSDASLASARMLEGQRQANDLQYQGFLADDREIRRTQAEALQRQEGNIARRSALANENRDAIIANNQAVAQLEASRIKQNWNSVDNFLKGVEGRVRERIDYQEALRRRKELEDRYDRRNYERIQDQRFNASKYQPELEQIDNLITAWEKANPTKSKERQSWYEIVTSRRAELADRLREDNLYSMAQRHGWEATHKYQQPGKYYDPVAYNWETIIHKNGGTLKLSSSQLIDKIIRKNEGNS